MLSCFSFLISFSPSCSRQGEQLPFSVSCCRPFFHDSSVRVVKILRFTAQTLKTSILSDYALTYFRESSYLSVIGVNHLLDIFNKTN